MFPFYKDPGKAANPYLDAIERDSISRFKPYTDNSSIGPGLTDQYGRMASDPVGSMEAIRGQYKQGAGHKRALYDAMMAGDNAAAAGGMAGTPMHQNQRMEDIAGINDQYERAWTRDAMDNQRYGMQGQQGMFDRSMDANRYLNETTGDLNYSRAKMGMNNAQQGNRMKMGLIKLLMQGAGTALGGPTGTKGGGAIADFFSGVFGNKSENAIESGGS